MSLASKTCICYTGWSATPSRSAHCLSVSCLWCLQLKKGLKRIPRFLKGLFSEPVFFSQALISAGSSSPPLLVSRLFPEHGAGHRLLPQSARHELPGVPHVLLLLVFIVVPVSEPRVRPAAHAGPRRPETALPRRQAPQGHQRAGGDGADLRQSQFSSEANRLEPESRPCAVLSGLSSSDLCLLVYRPQTSSCLL